MLRSLTAALVAGTALLGATAARAETYWSIGINVPAAGVVVANTPRYHVHEAAPVYYVPPPRYVQREIYYAPPPRVVYEMPRHRHWHHHHHHHGRHDRWDARRGQDRYDHRWDDGHGPYRGR
jgi:hypothetical protein